MKSPDYVPLSTIEKNGKHYIANTFSITIRDGRGIDLGVKCHERFINWLKKEPLYAICSIEKTGNAAHFQAGVVFRVPLRQDNLRTLLMSFYKDMNWDQSQMKYALKVKCHNEAKVLFKYCSKESKPIVEKLWTSLHKLRGCLCNVKWQMCRICDPRRHDWDTRLEFIDFWKRVESGNKLFLRDYIPEERCELRAAYDPWFYRKPIIIPTPVEKNWL